MNSVISKERGNVSVTVTGEVAISGGVLADIFWSMTSDEQAIFFNNIGYQSLLCFQLQAITDDKNLKLSGRAAMAMIGNYSQSDAAI